MLARSGRTTIGSLLAALLLLAAAAGSLAASDKDATQDAWRRIVVAAPPFFAESLYAAALPPGPYRLGSFLNFQGGGMVSIRSAFEVPPKLGTFHVEKGRITGLGQPLLTWPVDGRHAGEEHRRSPI